jgi:hypothetical protein
VRLLILWWYEVLPEWYRLIAGDLECFTVRHRDHRSRGQPDRHRPHRLVAVISAVHLPAQITSRLRDLIYDFQPHEAGEVFAGWLENAAADPADGYTAGDYAEHIRTEFSTYRWLLEPMLAVAGFEITSVTFDRRLYGAYTCVKNGDRAR